MKICSNCHIIDRMWLFALRHPPIRLERMSRNLSAQPANSWQPVIGLEIHAQINTESKLFSKAKNQFMAPPNSLVSEFDAALPGTLPVLNKSCVEAAVLTALSLGCHINCKSYFDRKHYFYADLPQGYQITQYWKPIAENGSLTIPTTYGSRDSRLNWKEVKIERIQLEQDSGKSLHDDKEKISLIDLNRAGVGLMEIVTAPEFCSAEEVATFVLDLQLTLKKLGTCRGKIAEGNLRVDANISLHLPGEPLGVRSEVKNIAGITALVDAINIRAYLAQVVKLLMKQGNMIPRKVSMRDKEEFQDYRFMPEPNLPPLILYTNKNLPNSFDSEKQINIDQIREKLRHLRHPSQIRQQLLGIESMTIQESSFLLENQVAEYFLDVLANAPHVPTGLVSQWVKIELLGLIHKLNTSAEECPINAAQMAELLTLVHENALDQTHAATTFKIAAEKGGSPKEIMEAMGWKLINDIPTIETYCIKAILAQDQEKLFRKFRRGEHSRPKNKKAIKLIVDHVLDLTDRKAHTKVTQSVAKDLLDQYCVRFQKKNFEQT